MVAEPAEQVRQLPRRINEAWLKGPVEELAECFHEDMIIAGPDLQPLASGREACVRSYVDFVGQATIRECRLAEPR
jgi:hypothetical protein